MRRTLLLPLAGAATAVVVLASIAALATGVASCSDAKAPAQAAARPFDIVLRVSLGPAAPAAPAPNVAVRVAGAEVGTTDASGALPLHLRGNEGERVEVTLACPQGFDPPAFPLRITLMRFPERATPPIYDAACSPQTRRVVAAIRAEHGARLPITLRGQTLGWTDATGAALVMITAKPGERVELGLDTDAAKPKLLRPRNPSLTFVAPEHDDIVLLEQKLTLESESPRRAASAPPSPAPVSPLRL